MKREMKNSWIGRGKRHAIFFALGLCATQASAEVRVGNGGHVIVCTEKKKVGESEVQVITVQALDHWEAKNVYDFPLDTGDKSKPALEQVEYVIKRVEKTSRLEANKLRKNVAYFEANKTLVPNTTLPKTPDMGRVLIPDNCAFGQGILRRKPDDFDIPKEYLVSEKFWNALDEQNKALLILHEAVYKEDAENGRESSRPSRYFNAYISSTKMDSITLETWRALGKKVGRALYAPPMGLPKDVELECSGLPEVVSGPRFERQTYEDCYGKWIVNIPSTPPVLFAVGNSQTFPKLKGNFIYENINGRTYFFAESLEGWLEPKAKPIKIVSDLNGGMSNEIFKGCISYRDTTSGGRDERGNLSISVRRPDDQTCKDHKGDGAISRISAFGLNVWYVSNEAARANLPNDFPQDVYQADIKSLSFVAGFSNSSTNRIALEFWNSFGQAGFFRNAKINGLPVEMSGFSVRKDDGSNSLRTWVVGIASEKYPAMFIDASSGAVVTVPATAYDALLNSELKLIKLNVERKVER